MKKERGREGGGRESQGGREERREERAGKDRLASSSPKPSAPSLEVNIYLEKRGERGGRQSEREKQFIFSGGKTK